MNKKLQQGLIIAATIITIGANALAEILPINGLSTATISDSLHIYFVPAGYVFSIWGIIYLLLTIFSFAYPNAENKKKNYMEEIFPLYILSAILNSAWIVLWHYQFFLTTVVLMVSLLVTLITIYQILRNNPATTLKEKLLIHVPFSVYLAWICVATIANISGALWLVQWSAFGIAGPVWAAIMIGIAGLLGIFITLTSTDFAFALVLVWALVGIMIKFPTEVVIQNIGWVVVILLAASWGFKRLQDWKK